MVDYLNMRLNTELLLCTFRADIVGTQIQHIHQIDIIEIIIVQVFYALSEFYQIDVIKAIGRGSKTSILCITKKKGKHI